MESYGINVFNNAWLNSLAQPVTPPTSYGYGGPQNMMTPGVSLPQQPVYQQNPFTAQSPFTVYNTPVTINSDPNSFSVAFLNGSTISQSYMQTKSQIEMMMIPVVAETLTALPGIMQSAATRAASNAAATPGSSSSGLMGNTNYTGDPDGKAMAALNWALAEETKNQGSQQGVTEADDRQYIIDEYSHGVAALQDPGNGWCAAFVSSAFEKNGGSPWGFKTFVRDIRKWGQDNNRYFRKENGTPQPGDVIIFEDNGASHTGIVKEVKDGKVYTIEGNTSSSVHQRSYSLNHGTISGYVRPYGSL